MKKSFTLVELLIAISLSTIVAGSLLAVFLSGLASQKRTLALNELLNQVDYMLEHMGRELRLAKKDDLGGEDCLEGVKKNYEVSSGNTQISFKDFEGNCRSFFLQQERIFEQKEGMPALPLTSLRVTNLRFEISGETQDDNLQPRVTIFFEIETKERYPQRLKFQTSISQRDLDVPR